MIGGAVETNTVNDNSLKLFAVQDLKRTDASTEDFSPLSFGEISEKTRHEVTEEGRISFKLTSNEANEASSPITPAPGTSLKKEVDAVVIAIHDVSVICEVLLDTENVEIQLPQALFPKKPHYGMPISISLDDSSGYTVPIVRVRSVLGESQEYDKTELAELVDSL